MKTMNKLIIYVLIMFLMVNTASDELVATTITVSPSINTINVGSSVHRHTCENK